MTFASRFLSNDATSAAPLAVFRIGFGFMMAFGVIRFWANGWIEKLYLDPSYHFSYRYFDWVKPLGQWTYLLYAVMFVASLGIMLGVRYRISAAVFFLSFTYAELMDKTTYLNHYYFVSLLAFALCWLPADRTATIGRGFDRRATVPRWTIDALCLFVAVVYFYAGLAKLNSDWLLNAQPLSIWLPAKYDLPLLGDLLQRRWVHFAFAWSGAAYDLLIPFLLFYRPTRPYAFGLVVVFHVLTRILFPIGMFPFVMIVSALVFFRASVHEGVLSILAGLVRGISGRVAKVYPVARRQVQGWRAGEAVGSGNGFTPAKLVVACLLVAHVLLPWRYLLSPGEVFWTEEGYRFSWRVMLMEKAGYISYRLENPVTGRAKTVDVGGQLTAFQAKQLATQPDFIVEYAHHLAELEAERSGVRPRVFAESYVALNGRPSRPYVDPSVDLTIVDLDTPRLDYLMPFEDDIHGL